MPEVSMKSLLSAGVHFGHQTHRWNPKMKPYIFGARNGIYIIDLEQTVSSAVEACRFVKKVASEGGKIVFVATKRQAKLAAEEAARRAGMPYVTERWLGGTLTNFSTIRRSIDRLLQLEKWKEDGTYGLLPKKEVVRLERKRKKLLSSLGGLKDLKGLPQAIFLIDPEMENIAVAESNRLGIPVIAVVDTNCDPDPIDYVIPGNDDALKSVKLFLDLIADACLEGSAVYEQILRQQVKPQPSATVTAEGEKAAKESGPIVERVVRRQLKIPTEFDDRDVLEEETEAKTEASESQSTEAEDTETEE